ncbi:hypothetical protein M436DRAFT_66720 [Aureobasidium namibiae CBS 147.97]|uniref:Uncharacterized protein n=1 Tax=Aureobasidium namibiae CBS 147.97 TaxID=1043004 RepID=A0A074X5J2_9PEZI
MDSVNNWSTNLISLIHRIENVYQNQWAHPAEEKPVIFFDKESCCKSPVNENHNLWWAYVQPRVRPSVVGSGKTLEDAMTSLYGQLKSGPQHWTQIDASTTDKEVFAKKAAKNKRRKLAKLAATEEQRTTYVHDYNLRSKTWDSWDPSVFVSLPDLPAGPAVLPIESAALPTVQLPNPAHILQPRNITPTTGVGCVSAIEEDDCDMPDGTLTRVAPLQWRMHLRGPSSPRSNLTPNSSGPIGNPTTHAPSRESERYPTVPNMFRFGSSHDLLASLSRDSVLSKMRANEKPKEAGIETDENEESHVLSVARKQAQKTADLSTARHDSSTQVNTFNYIPPSSSHQGQDQQKATLSPARQKLGTLQAPFLSTKPTESLPGDMGFTSSFDHPAVFSSGNSKQGINAFPSQENQTLPVFGQYRSKLSDSPSTDRRSCSPVGSAHRTQYRAKRELSASPVERGIEKKIKVEDTG